MTDTDSDTGDDIKGGERGKIVASKRNCIFVFFVYLLNFFVIFYLLKSFYDIESIVFICFFLFLDIYIVFCFLFM
jgi:hypothetical protein